VILGQPIGRCWRHVIRTVGSPERFGSARIRYVRRFVGVLIIAVIAVIAVGCSGGAKSGVVTGYIEPCIGTVASGSTVPPYAAGTVTALRGKAGLRKVADGYQEVLPTAVARRTRVKTNEEFRLKLAPGDYVLVAAYDEPGAGTTVLSVTVRNGGTLRRNLPDTCK
jgi:hypothetical protein